MSRGSGVFIDEFRIVHKRISDCINYRKKPRDSGFAKEEIQDSLKHPVAVELVDATPSQEDCKKYGNNAITH
jgi:hypothetical protein